VPVDFFEGQRQVYNWSGRINVFRRSTVFRRTTGICVILGLYVFLGHALQKYFEVSSSLAFGEVTLLAGVLSLLLVLRSNSAYDRWWEGRKLWGKLVNDSRNLALKIKNMVDCPQEEKDRVGDWIVGFPFALRDHLRGGPLPETVELLPDKPGDDILHLPAYISSKIFAQMRSWREQKLVDKFDYHLIDQHISALMDICGACERIRNTPPPLSHRALIPQLLIIYLVIVPLGVEPTPSNVLLGFGLAYFLIGIEVVAEELEEPFGQDSDDLPLDTISFNIKRSVKEILRG
jgi:putative membrane protein